jgi:uncharacterized membrane protein
MLLAVCLGPEMLIVPLLLLAVLGAGCLTLLVLAARALYGWADARQKRLAAEGSHAPTPGAF